MGLDFVPLAKLQHSVSLARFFDIALGAYIVT
jgi:hypothetical protein